MELVISYGFAIIYECVCLELERYLVYKLTQFPAAVLDTCNLAAELRLLLIRG